MANERERIEALRARGALTRKEADELLSALEFLEARERGAEAPAPADARPPSRGARRKLAFLRGEIGEEDLLSDARRAAAAAGVAFGLIMGLGHAVVGPFVFPSGSPSGAIAIGLLAGFLHLVISGPLFGWAFHRFHLRPAAERLAALVRESGPMLAPPAPMPAGRCPTCAAENARTYGRRHPVVLHWVWNPGLAFNELALGQRCPARLSSCRECGTSFTDCDACGRSVDCAEWSGRAALGHRAELPCPHCGAPIPCARNAWARFLEAPARLVAR